MNIFALIFSVLGLLLLGAPFQCPARLRSREQLRLLSESAEAIDLDRPPIDWDQGARLLKQMTDRMGRAGFIGKEDRRSAGQIAFVLIIGSATIGAAAGFQLSGFVPALFACIAGAYFGLTAFLSFLQFRTRDFEREILFQTPIFLEAVILLVESGLGILPALERVVASTEKVADPNPLERMFGLVYQLAAHGMPFGIALETVGEASSQRVIRHVMLHLDISGNEGGELIPSLRSLSDHAHIEWKLSVEDRVKRLENYVVFPVFASVIGLMLLTSAVPVMPLLNLKELLEQRQQLRTGTETTELDSPVRDFIRGAKE